MIRLRQPWCGTGWIVCVSCAVLGMASAAGQSPPPPSREELLRQWDLDRDGKVDASETELARSRMRRTRNEALMNSGTDPVTGRPRTRATIDPATGRPLAPQAAANEPPDRRGEPSAPADDGGLILVPGTGAPADGMAGTAISPPARVTQPDRPALPGARVPATASAVPSVAPRIPLGGAAPAAADRRDAGGGELSSRARIIPGMQQRGMQPSGVQEPPTGQSNSGARGLRPLGSIPNLPPDRQTQAGERPGIFSGGVRAGGPAARPGYGAGGPPTDLNAGRLPGGLPQTRGQTGGVAPGTSVGPRAGALPPGAGRFAGPGQVPSRPGMVPSAGRVGPAMPSTGVPSTGVPSTAGPLAPRPTLRQPAVTRPQSQAPSTVPRVPRVSPDDFYGR